MKYKNEITVNTTIEELVDILEREINDSGFYDTVHLNDILQKLNSPILQDDKYGDRKINPTVGRKLNEVVEIKYDNSDNCWYKKK